MKVLVALLLSLFISHFSYSLGENCSNPAVVVMGTNTAPNAPYWYTYTATQEGWVTISSLGCTTEDTLLEIYDACGGNLLGVSDDSFDDLEIANIDDVGGQSVYSIYLTNGQSIKIFWSGEFSTEAFDWIFSTYVPAVGEVCNNSATANLGANTSPFTPYFYEFTAPSANWYKVTTLSPTAYSGIFDDCNVDGLDSQELTEDGLFYLNLNETANIFWADFESHGGVSWDIDIYSPTLGESCNYTKDAVIGVNTTTVIGSAGEEWYSYTASGKISLKLSSVGNTSEDTRVSLTEVATASQCNEFSLENDDFEDDLTVYSQSEIDFIMDAGDEILIRWENQANSNEFSWELTENFLVTGDDCIIPEVVGAGAHTISESNYWYEYTAPSAQTIRISSSVPTGNLGLGIYGDCGDYTGLDIENSFDSEIVKDISLSNGEVILINWLVENPTLNWSISVITPIAGQICESAATATIGNNTTTTSFNKYWYKYTSPSNQTMVFSTVNNNIFGVYSNCPTTFEPGYYDWGDLDYLELGASTEVIVPLAASETIYIPLWNVDTNADLNIEVYTPVQGQICSEAEPVTSDTYTYTESDPFVSYWYTYTASSDYTITITSKNLTSVNTYVELYRDCNEGSYFLDSDDISDTNLQSEIVMNIYSGETILIRWRNNGFTTNSFDWQLIESPIMDGIDCARASNTNIGLNRTTTSPMWYTYTSPSDQDITISSVGNTLKDTNLTLYDGCGGSIISTNDDFSGTQSEITYTIATGETIKIGWDLKGFKSIFDWEFDGDPVTPPVDQGETCEDPIAITENTYSAPSTDTWYSYTFGSDGSILLSSVGSSFDTYFAIYSACGASPVMIVDDVPGSATLEAEGIYTGTNGETIYIVWGNWDDFDYDWTLSQYIPSVGEICENSITATETTYTAPSTITWYDYTFSADESIIISSMGSGVDTYFQVYNSCGATPVMSIDDPSGSLEAEGIYSGTNGETIYIEWGNFDGSGYDWSLSVYTPAAGETCETAATPVFSQVGSNNTTPSGDYWYSFTASQDRELFISNLGNTTDDTEVSIYNSCGGDLIDYNDDKFGQPTSELSISVSTGETIYIHWVNNDSNNGFDWTFSEVGVSAGDVCAQAITAIEGTNNSPYAPYWFTYTASQNEDVTISSVGSTSEDTYLWIFDDCNGNLLGESDDFNDPDLQSELSLTLASGETIKIYWRDDYSAVAFNWNLSVTPIVPSTGDYFWVGNGGNWDDLNHWATNSGGSTKHTVLPSIDNDVYFDANSFSASGQVVEISDAGDNSGKSFKTMDWTGVTNNPEFRVIKNTSTWIENIAGGSLIFSPNMTLNFLNCEFYFQGDNYIIDTKGLDLGTESYLEIGANSSMGTANISSDINGSYIGINGGATFNSNGYSIFSPNYFWVFDDANTSTINLSNSEITTSRLYYIPDNTGSMNLVNNNTLYTIIPDQAGIAEAWLGGQSLNNISIGESLTVFKFGGSINTLEISPGTELRLDPGETYTVSDLIATGSESSRITIKSITNGQTSTISKTSGTVNADWLILEDNIATGGATFNAAHSISNGNVSGWNFPCTDVINLDVTITDESCAGANDGELSALGSGGPGSFQFSLYDNTNYQVSGIFSGLSAGVYDVYMKNEYGCEVFSTYTINATPTTNWYADTDNDGFGDPNDVLSDCSQPLNYVDNADDCDDTNGAIYPGATEVPGSVIDYNCDGLIADDFFWIGAGSTDSWYDVNNWSTASGGGTDQSRYPNQYDNVFFDANSFSSTGGVVEIPDQGNNLGVSFNNMDWTGVTNNPEFKITVTTSDWIQNIVLGSMTLDLGMTLNFSGAEFYFNGSNYSIDTKGLDFGPESSLIFGYDYQTEPIGTLNPGKGGLPGIGNIMSDIKVEYILLWGDGLTWNSNGYSIEASEYFQIWNAGPQTIDISNSNIVTQKWVYRNSNDDTFISSNSSINISPSSSEEGLFNGNNELYNNLSITTGTSSFNENATFNQLAFNSNQTITFQSGKTYSFNNLDAIGTQNNSITLQSSIEGTPAIFSQSTGTVDVDWLILKGITATGGATFNATHSLDFFNNIGWNFICSQTLSLTLEVTSPLICQDASDAVITATGSGDGAQVGLWYNLDNTDFTNTTGVFENVSPGDYTIEMIDRFGCTITAMINVANPTDPTWYADSDGDGFGDPGTSQVACIQPSGYILDNTDCNDAEATAFPGGTDVAGSGIDGNCDGNFIWYVDSDNDGFGSSTLVSSTSSTPGALQADNNADCDDTNSNIETASWYIDSDNDGFGDPNTLVYSCNSPGSSYVSDNTDCDDGNAQINTSETDTAGSGIDSNCDGLYLWYIDADGDSYGESGTISSTNTTPGSGESSNNTDCDDTDPLVNPTIIWYADSDSDGFGDLNTTTTSCTKPTGYVADNTDCDDTDATASIGKTWYEDSDGDGYGNSSVTSLACAKPTGYVDDNTDCDDTSAAINPETIWYEDADGDGYGKPNTATTGCSIPGSGVYATNDEDCNDSDPDINPGEVEIYGDGRDNNCDGIFDQDQSITFELSGPFYYGDVIELSATSTSGLIVSFSVNSGPASISGSTLTFNDTGNVIITASQTGNNDYLPASDVNIEVLSEQVVLDVTVQNATMVFGNTEPEYVLSYSGFIGSDSENDIETPPSVISPNITGAGQFALELSGGSDNNYSFNFTSGTLTVDKREISVSVSDEIITFGDPIPEFTLLYEGFTDIDNQLNNVDELPTGSVTTNGDAGIYTINISGGDDADYSFIYTTGVLTIEKATAEISFSNLDKTYNGTEQTPTITTSPSNLNYSVTYNGSANLPVETGSYEVQVVIDDTNYNGEAEATFTISEILGIESYLRNVLELYPNPANNYLKLNWNSVKERTVSLYNFQGAQVTTESLSGNNHIIDLSSYSIGNYRLVIKEDGNLYQTNILISR